MNPSRGCLNVPDVAFGASYSPESRDGLRVCMEKVPAGVASVPLWAWSTQSSQHPGQDPGAPRTHVRAPGHGSL